MVDFGEMMSNFNLSINDFFEKVQAYFKSLTQYETIAWIAFGVGLVMVIMALVLW
jgi:flagellar biosynthesis/type III secretory pathway M-ring protein FliF/YscJ